MKILISIILLLNFGNPPNDNEKSIEQVREYFFLEEADNIRAEKLNSYLTNYDDQEALILCYKGVGRAMMASRFDILTN